MGRRKMGHRFGWGLKERNLRSKLLKFLRDRPFIRGSLFLMARTCGNPTCKCTRGEKHESLYLTTRVVDSKGKSKRKMIHIPPPWEERIRAWVEAYQQSEKMIEEISDETLKRLLESKAETSQRSSSES